MWTDEGRGSIGGKGSTRGVESLLGGHSYRLPQTSDNLYQRTKRLGTHVDLGRSEGHRGDRLDCLSNSQGDSSGSGRRVVYTGTSSGVMRSGFHA